MERLNMGTFLQSPKPARRDKDARRKRGKKRNGHYQTSKPVLWVCTPLT